MSPKFKKMSPKSKKMSPKSKKGGETDDQIDPEVLMRQKFRAKCRFRALVRLVIANVYWLSDSIETYEGDEVKRRVKQLLTHKKKRLLTFEDKALLNKPAKDRTDQEKKHLYRKIGNLKCFKRYPVIVRKKLAAATYFSYYGPGRVIVRENQEARAMYFIVNGKLVNSRMVLDEVTQEYFSETLEYMGTGEIFGEMSLLHKLPWVTTVTAVDHCEFLVIKQEDFNDILLYCVQKDWDEVQEAMNLFTYFDRLDPVAKREGCTVAKFKYFKPDDIILGDGHGVLNYVYFVLSGDCQMIESLKCFVTKIGHVTKYTLYDPFEKEEVDDLEKKYFESHMTKDNERSEIKNQGHKKESLELSKSKSWHGKISESKSTITIKDPNIKVSKSLHETISKSKSKSSIKDTKIDDSNIKLLSTKTKSSVDQSNTSKPRSLLKVDSRKRVSSLPELELSLHRLRFDSKTEEGMLTPKSSLGLVLEDNKENNGPAVNTHTFFMQVLQYKPGSTFGFEENMRDRRIVALTNVHCMLMPRYWLMQHNTGNIWKRIQYYLDKKIPKKEKLFKELIQDLDWLKYRDTVVQEVRARSNALNFTSVHDVPYYIRLKEMYDY